MFIPVLMLFILGIGVPVFSLLLGFMSNNTSGWGWLAITVVSMAAIVGAVVIYGIARLQRKREE